MNFKTELLKKYNINSYIIEDAVEYYPSEEEN